MDESEPETSQAERLAQQRRELPDSPGVELTCFGPVVEEGFGLSYTIHDDGVRCVVTNFHGLAEDFTAELERVLTEMHALLVEGAR